MMRSRLAIILLATACLFLGIASPCPAVTLSVGSAVGAPGATVEITVVVDDPGAVAGVAFTVTYDTDALELVSVVDAPLLDRWVLGQERAGTGTPFCGSRSAGVPDASTLAVFRFRIKTDAESSGQITGDYPVGLDASWIDNSAAGYLSPTVLPMLYGVNPGADPLADPVAAFPVLATVVNSGVVSVDRDGDGLPDTLEAAMDLDPNDADTDGDGMPDGWEHDRGLDPASPGDAFLDSDGDGASNLREYLGGTDPADQDEKPLGRLADGDGDGDTDGEDLAWVSEEFGTTGCGGSPPCRFDLDGDGDVDRTDLLLVLEEYGVP